MRKSSKFIVEKAVSDADLLQIKFEMKKALSANASPYEVIEKINELVNAVNSLLELDNKRLKANN